MNATRQPTPTPIRGALFVLLVAGLLCVGSAQAQQEGDGFDVFTGRMTFQRYCASCHGPEAQGDGNISQYLKVQPADLTGITAKYGEFPADRIEGYIDGREDVRGHGTREMPVWGEVFQSTLAEPAPSEEEGEERAERIIDQLVSYLRSIQVE